MLNIDFDLTMFNSSRKNFIEENAAKIMEVYDYEWTDEEI